MFEHYRQPLLSRQKFFLRIARSVSVAFLLLTVTVLCGMACFHYAEGLSWLDAFLNSVMIMTGVGTIGSISSSAGKILTGVYSILSTLIFFIVLAIIFTPLLHRLLHRFHLDMEQPVNRR